MGFCCGPTDFAVDEAADRAFVVNAGHSRIEVFQRGHYLTALGRGGRRGRPVPLHRPHPSHRRYGHW